MHPSHAMPIRELLANPAEILRDCQERVNAQISGAKIDLVSKVHDGGGIAFKQIERQTAKERVRGGIIR